MTTNKRFQLSRNVHSTIHSLCFDEANQRLRDDSHHGFLLGFDCGPLTTIVGITKNPVEYHANLNVIGVFCTKPDVEIDKYKEILHGISENKIPETINLIYGPDLVQTDRLKAKYYCTKSREFIKDCDLNIGEENKLYTHSTVASIHGYVRLKISRNNLQEAKIREAINEAKTSLETSCTIQLDGSSLKMDYPKGLPKQNISTESLYDALDAPADIKNSGDYLPNMSKKDLEKLVVKWRNKVKTLREPLTFSLLENDIVVAMDKLIVGDNDCIQHLEVYTYIHMKDPLVKTWKTLLNGLTNQLDAIQSTLIDFYVNNKMEFYQPKPYNFKPEGLSHFIPAIYPIDDSIDSSINTVARRAKIKEQRRKLHETFIIPADRPTFRIVNRYRSGPNVDEAAGYLCNVHLGLDSGIKGGLKRVIGGTYTYHHYMQDGKNDSGWGCAYRSLQTIVSWFKHQGYLSQLDNTTEGKSTHRVPSHEEIQQALVDVGDKQKSFIGSSLWIGSQEVCYVLNHLYQIESKIMAVSSGSELVYKARELAQHFEQQSTPIMIGGGVLAHTIIGIDFNEKNGDVSYLILDPHYTGAEDLQTIQKKGWCGWKKSSFWDKNSFYNLCLPQRPNDF